MFVTDDKAIAIIFQKRNNYTTPLMAEPFLITQFLVVRPQDLLRMRNASEYFHSYKSSGGMYPTQF